MSSHAPAFKVLTSAILFGTVGTAIAYAPENAGGSALGIGRLAIGAVLLLIFMPVFGGKRTNVFVHAKKKSVFFMAVGAAAFQPFFFSATTSNGGGAQHAISGWLYPNFYWNIERDYLS